MDKYEELPTELLQYCNVPFKNLQTSGRVWLSHNLNPLRSLLSPTNNLLQDWRGVAEYFGFDTLYIENFQRSSDPLGEVMRNIPIMNSEVTLGDFMLALFQIERHDVLQDPVLSTIFDKCPKESLTPLRNSEPMVQVPEIDSQSETCEILTVGERERGEIEYFDAFVCYTHQDNGFVREMLYELETKKNLKLCIPERDVLPGPAKYDAYTKLIKERCGPMIIILSPDYFISQECRFLTYFAHALRPDAKDQKLIPVIYKRCEIPNVLNHISLVDYTRHDVIEWFWSRLSNSIQAWKTKRNILCGNYSQPFPSLPSYHSMAHPQQIPSHSSTSIFPTHTHQGYFESNYSQELPNKSIQKTGSQILEQPQALSIKDKNNGTEQKKIVIDMNNLDTISCKSFSSLEENPVFTSSSSNNIMGHLLSTGQCRVDSPSTSSNVNSKVIVLNNGSQGLRRNVSDETTPQNRNNDIPDDCEFENFISVPAVISIPSDHNSHRHIKKKFFGFLGKSKK